MTDSIDDLFEQEEEKGDGEDRWNFDENPEIRGILVGVGTGPDMGYGKFHILRIKEKDTEKTWNVAVFGVAFKSRTEELAPKVGAPIGVRYEGLKSNKDGSREYKSWLVVSPDSDHPFWHKQIAGLMGRGGDVVTQGQVENRGSGTADPVGDFF